ncbi:alpha/beta hydrolase [Fibrobacter sp. UWEL]|uniref:alpha/beta hydrolase n=1 Tax=Fibrobacter sp. UWEL TaxID=1896209 RepID=UPI000920499A|nr:alpha/beta hydrolase [Fibrobacter sp. UWEL]SHK81507.1 arylformamidase [Fibrobacter sp. UWEL]
MSELVYRGFTQAELDAGYDNSNAVADSALLLKAFDNRSDMIAKEFVEFMHLTYGNGTRNRFDYFSCGNRKAPLFLFIHGGYWQMRCKDTFRFLARGPLANGFNVANVGYTLAPEMSLTGIIYEIRLAIKVLRSRADELGFDANRIYVSGWSAGGHLCVSVLDETGVQGALAISGIYDLEPISKSYLNEKLKLTSDEVIRLSPARVPLVRKPVVIVSGSDELPELRRQSLEFATLRAAERVPGTYSLLEGHNHFSILTELEKTNGALSRMLCMMAGK